MHRKKEQRVKKSGPLLALSSSLSLSLSPSCWVGLVDLADSQPPPHTQKVTSLAINKNKEIAKLHRSVILSYLQTNSYIHTYRAAENIKTSKLRFNKMKGGNIHVLSKDCRVQNTTLEPEDKIGCVGSFFGENVRVG